MDFSLTSFLNALSPSVDAAEDRRHDHSRVVALLSLRLGKTAGLTGGDLDDLFVLSVLHDSGMGPARLRQSAGDDGLLPAHCLEGEKGIMLFPLDKIRVGVIKYHHENHDGSGPFGVAGEDIPLFSQFIRLADVVETKFNVSWVKMAHKEQIRRYVQSKRNRLFSPDIVDIFMEASEEEDFWEELESSDLSDAVGRAAPLIDLELKWENVVPVTQTFMKIADSKSRYTYAHSEGVTRILDSMSYYYNFDSHRMLRLHIAGNLHDIGRLFVPASLLDKASALSAREMSTVRKHVLYTRAALEGIEGFEDIASWASNHHETLDGTGYPAGLEEGELDFESRLMCVADAYHVLLEERPHRRAATTEEALTIVSGMARRGMLDPQITSDLRAALADVRQPNGHMMGSLRTAGSY